MWIFDSVNYIKRKGVIHNKDFLTFYLFVQIGKNVKKKLHILVLILGK